MSHKAKIVLICTYFRLGIMVIQRKIPVSNFAKFACERLGLNSIRTAAFQLFELLLRGSLLAAPPFDEIRMHSFVSECTIRST